MSDFVNTIDAIGDDAVVAGLLERSITEFCDDVLTYIASHAFYGCSKLATVKLPKVTTAERQAFNSCTNLTNVSLDLLLGPKSTDGSSMFSGCSKLVSIHLPSWKIKISSGMFTNCSKLLRCDMPLAIGVTSSAFANCSNLMEIRLPCATSLDGSSFMTCSKLCALTLPYADAVVTISSVSSYASNIMFFQTGYIFVPSSLLESYKAATNWSAYAGRFKAMENYNALDKWDEDYTNAGYTIVHPKTVFTTATADSGATYTFNLSSAIVFEAGKTYKVLYDHNEYEIVATDQGIVHEADDETVFTIGQSNGSAVNVVQTRAELFSSVIGIYAM